MEKHTRSIKCSTHEVNYYIIYFFPAGCSCWWHYIMRLENIRVLITAITCSANSWLHTRSDKTWWILRVLFQVLLGRLHFHSLVMVYHFYSFCLRRDKVKKAVLSLYFTWRWRQTCCSTDPCASPYLTNFQMIGGTQLPEQVEHLYDKQ